MKIKLTCSRHIETEGQGIAQTLAICEIMRKMIYRLEDKGIMVEALNTETWDKPEHEVHGIRQYVTVELPPEKYNEVILPLINQDVEAYIIPEGMIREVYKIEKGWAGHHVCAHMCQFRRHTELILDALHITVSTVGMIGTHNANRVGTDRYYETMVFLTHREYDNSGLPETISFSNSWAIGKPDEDYQANAMHEAIATEISERMLQGEYERS